MRIEFIFHATKVFQLVSDDYEATLDAVRSLVSDYMEENLEIVPEEHVDEGVSTGKVSDLMLHLASELQEQIDTFLLDIDHKVKCECEWEGPLTFMTRLKARDDWKTYSTSLN